MINLEPLCSKYGHRMIINGANIEIKEQENVVTNALNVLAENGMYALCIYLLSCNKKEYGEKYVLGALQDLWCTAEINLIPVKSHNMNVMLENVRKITENLPKLILARRITEQTLIFARYHAKAKIAAETKIPHNDYRKGNNHNHAKGNNYRGKGNNYHGKGDNRSESGHGKGRQA